MTAADHPLDFESFDRGVGCLHPLEATRWPDHPLERAMICLNNVLQVFRCPVLDMLGKVAFLLQALDCHRIGGQLVGSGRRRRAVAHHPQCFA